MKTRRAVLLGLAKFGVGFGGFVISAFREALIWADTRHFRKSSACQSGASTLEYALAGDGPQIRMIHGCGAAYDQGLPIAGALRERGFRVLASSRFGYLDSAFPEDPSHSNQAETLVDLLYHLAINTIPVVGGSSGALAAAAFAHRHPNRCSHLGLLVPAANLTNRGPVEFAAVQRFVVGAVLGSDFAFWSLSRLAPDRMIGTLPATDPALFEVMSAAEPSSRTDHPRPDPSDQPEAFPTSNGCPLERYASRDCLREDRNADADCLLRGGTLPRACPEDPHDLVVAAIGCQSRC